MQTVTRTGKILLGTLNETETISAVLEEIAESIQTLTALGWTLSVVIVDDGVGNILPELALQCARRCGIAVEVISGGRQGLGAAFALTGKSTDELMGSMMADKLVNYYG